MRTIRFGLLAVLAATLVAALGVSLTACGEPARAAFPGTNGKIAFERGNDIYGMDVDGRGLASLANRQTGATRAPWSPHGLACSVPLGRF